MPNQNVDFDPLRDAGWGRSFLILFRTLFFTSYVFASILTILLIALSIVFHSWIIYIPAFLVGGFTLINIYAFLGTTWDESWKKFCKQNGFEQKKISDEKSYVPPSLFMKSSDEAAVTRDLSDAAIVKNDCTWEVYEYTYGKLSAFSSTANYTANLDVKEYFSWRQRGDQFFTIARTVALKQDAISVESRLRSSAKNVTVERNEECIFIFTKGRLTKESVQRIFSALS